MRRNDISVFHSPKPAQYHFIIKETEQLKLNRKDPILHQRLNTMQLLHSYYQHPPCDSKEGREKYKDREIRILTESLKKNCEGERKRIHHSILIVQCSPPTSCFYISSFDFFSQYSLSSVLNQFFTLQHSIDRVKGKTNYKPQYQ